MRVPDCFNIGPEDVDEAVVVVREVQPFKRCFHKAIDRLVQFKQSLCFLNGQRYLIILDHGLANVDDMAM